ncbi:hypothetical protein ACVS9P_02590 [Caproicibacterium sp. NSD3]
MVEFSKDNITFMIAIIGFFLSLYNFIKSCWESSCHLQVLYKSHTCGERYDKRAMLVARLIFENRSSRKIAISRMFLEHNNKRYEFAFPKHEVWKFTTRSGGKITDEQQIFSQEIPFEIEGYGTLGGYFILYLPLEMKEDFSKDTTFDLLIYTNRKKLRVSLSADNFGTDSEQYG